MEKQKSLYSNISPQTIWPDISLILQQAQLYIPDIQNWSPDWQNHTYCLMHELLYDQLPSQYNPEWLLLLASYFFLHMYSLGDHQPSFMQGFPESGWNNFPSPAAQEQTLVHFLQITSYGSCALLLIQKTKGQHIHY